MVKTIKLFILIFLFSSNYSCKQQHSQSIKLSVKDTIVHTSYDSIIDNWYSNGGKNKDSLFQLLYEAGAINVDKYYSSVSSKKKSEIKIKLYGPDWIYSSSKKAMDRNDYNIGPFSFDVPFDSIKVQLGIPDSTITIDSEGKITGFYYPKIVVWTYNENHLINEYDILDAKYSTNRGLRIGDSLSSVLKLYPEEIEHGTNTSININYVDESFKDFTEWRVYSYSFNKDNNWMLIIFIKNNIVVKMSFRVYGGC